MKLNPKQQKQKFQNGYETLIQHKVKMTLRLLSENKIRIDGKMISQKNTSAKVLGSHELLTF